MPPIDANPVVFLVDVSHPRRQVHMILKKKLMRQRSQSLTLNQMMHHVLSKIVKREIIPCGRAHPDQHQATPSVIRSAHQTPLLFID